MYMKSFNDDVVIYTQHTRYKRLKKHQCKHAIQTDLKLVPFICKKKKKKEEMNGIAIIVSPSYNNFEDKLEVINYKLILFQLIQLISLLFYCFGEIVVFSC